MADQDFETDLRAMFDCAQTAPDADVFCAKVMERLERRYWIRTGLIVGLGLVGALIAWARLGLSISGFALGVGDLSATAMDNGGPWFAALLLMGLGLLLVRPSLSEN